MMELPTDWPESRKAWARNCLAEEIATGFQRGLQLTHFQSQIAIQAFLTLPKETQLQLVQVLYTGARFSGPVFEPIRSSLPEKDRAAINQLNSRMKELLYLESPDGEAYKWRSVTAGPEQRKLAKIVGRELSREFRVLAKTHGFTTSRVEPNVQWATKAVGGVEYNLEFDAARKFTLTYNIIHQKNGWPVRTCPYLTEIGLGYTAWRCLTPEAAPDVARHAFTFAIWHLEEFIALKAVK